jgi:hypothetical protein
MPKYHRTLNFILNKVTCTGQSRCNPRNKNSATALCVSCAFYKQHSLRIRPTAASYVRTQKNKKTTMLGILNIQLLGKMATLWKQVFTVCCLSAEDAWVRYGTRTPTSICSLQRKLHEGQMINPKNMYTVHRPHGLRRRARPSPTVAPECCVEWETTLPFGTSL